MKIVFCTHHHITTEACQRSHRMSKITENVLNLIFCVRQAHAMLIVGLVKSLCGLPIVHRLRSSGWKLIAWHTRASGICPFIDFFLETIFENLRGACLSAASRNPAVTERGITSSFKGFAYK